MRRQSAAELAASIVGLWRVQDDQLGLEYRCRKMSILLMHLRGEPW